VGANLVALDKSSVIGGSPTGIETGLIPRFSIVPTRQAGADADAFAVTNLVPLENSIELIKWDGSNFFVSDHAFTPTTPPPYAQQPAGGSGPCTTPCINTGDDRVESAVWGANGVLWASMNDACEPGGGVRACLRFDQFVVTDSSSSLVQDGDIGVTGWDLYYPAVDMDSSGNLLVALTASNASTNPSLAATGQFANGANANFAGVRLLHAGAAPYLGQRFGDYSGAAVDPANPGQVFVAAEESTTISGNVCTLSVVTQCNWSTTIDSVGLVSATGTPPGTTTAAFEGLGCCLASGSGPAASSWAPGRLDVFVRGTDNQLWHKWYAAGWSGFEALGGTTVDSPAAVSSGNGRIDVFVRGTDNQLWHRWYANGWSSWEPLGGMLSSGPAVTTWGPGRLDVFVRGTDNQLWHRWYANGWSSWEPLGGALTSAPGAVAWGAGRIDVFVKGSDNQLFHKFYAGSWSAFEGLGGNLASAPAVSSWGAGRLDVWIRGPGDNALYHKWYGNSGAGQPVDGWSLWVDQGGGLAGAPGAVSWSTGRQDVFVTGTDNDLHHTWSPS
jgi:Repeat of unknown function (DUF346)